MACASRHQPDKGFSDSEALFSAHTDAAHFRNSPTLANVGYRDAWMHDGRHRERDVVVAGGYDLAIGGGEGELVGDDAGKLPELGGDGAAIGFGRHLPGDFGDDPAEVVGWGFSDVASKATLMREGAATPPK